MAKPRLTLAHKKAWSYELSEASQSRNYARRSPTLSSHHRAGGPKMMGCIAYGTTTSQIGQIMEFRRPEAWRRYMP